MVNQQLIFNIGKEGGFLGSAFNSRGERGPTLWTARIKNPAHLMQTSVGENLAGKESGEASMSLPDSLEDRRQLLWELLAVRS